MLQSFAQSQDWLYTEPLLFDDEFCQSLMKDLQSLPTPPQSPPMKSGSGGVGAGGHHKPLSKEDQLSYVSDILLEDHDMQLNWNCDFFDPDYCDVDKPLDKVLPRIRAVSLGDSGEEESLWRCLGGGAEKGLLVSPSSSVLGSSPLLSDIDTSIFEEIAGSTLAVHAAALALDEQDPLDSQQEQSIESTSDYGSAGGELSTYSSSDSEEEIDVVTVVRCSSSPSPLPSLADLSARQQQKEEEEQRRRFNFDIQQQHNYAAPCPASPPPSSSSSTSSSSSMSSKKRSRGRDSSRHHRRHHSHRHYSPSSGRSSSSSSRHHNHHHSSARQSTETEDEEERRRTHNVMERQRRNELKNCFVRLRDNVPELSHNDKASKVVILKRARDSIHNLEVEDHRLLAKRDRLKEKQQRLKARLEQLRGF